MKKAVVIVGPTAVGKTSLAVKLAKKLNGAIISADSIQVFKSLDIISGKDKNELEGLKYYLIDIVSFEKPFSVSQFEKKASKILNSLNKTPIIVGGTGLYIKSIIDGIETSEVKPDMDLRRELEAFSLEELQEKLRSLDKKIWESMNESDRKNKRRIIRKIEIVGSKQNAVSSKRNQKIEFLQIGLELPREALKKNIDKRVDERIKNGAIDEAKKLFENYTKLTQQVQDANGYKQLFEHFQGKVSLEKAIERWKIAEYHHAKNQMTWFKKDKRILWFKADRKDLFKAVERKIDLFLSG